MNRFLLCISVLCVSFFAVAQKAVPELWGQRVHDEAKVLSAATVDNLEKQLKSFEDSTTNQIAVLIVPSLDGEVIEQYSLRVVETWKLGQAKNDNGVLLLVSIGDRKVRIEVGQGLEGVLTDALSSRIIRNEIAPNFRRGDYEGGIVAAVDAIIKATKGEYKADNVTARGRRGGGGGTGAFALIIFIVLGVFTYTALFAKGCAGWGTYGVLAPFYFFLPGVAIGNATNGLYIFLAYLIGFPILKLLFARTSWGQNIAQQMEQSSRNRRSGGGWSSGGGWFMGGGGGGSWGGGGGFSGGGGSFGGGGSSGSW
jgi:uncharacterized protein